MVQHNLDQGCLSETTLSYEDTRHPECSRQPLNKPWSHPEPVSYLRPWWSAFNTFLGLQDWVDDDMRRTRLQPNLRWPRSLLVPHPRQTELAADFRTQRNARSRTVLKRCHPLLLRWSWRNQSWSPDWANYQVLFFWRSFFFGALDVHWIHPWRKF